MTTAPPVLDARHFPAGTEATCNRCNQTHPLPREAAGVQENPYAWRLIELRTLACGHCDAHWIYVEREIYP